MASLRKQIEKNFSGLKGLIKDDEIYEFYISLIEYFTREKINKTKLSLSKLSDDYTRPDIKCGYPPKYPFRNMKVGDSFIWKDDYSRYNMAVAGNAARAWGKIQKPPRKFSTRKTEDNKIRIWRIE